jgi:hypothetical protein
MLKFLQFWEGFGLLRGGFVAARDKSINPLIDFGFKKSGTDSIVAKFNWLWECACIYALPNCAS